jgi:hypothetical protein
MGWRASYASAYAAPAERVWGDRVVVVVGEARALTENVRVPTESTSASTGAQTFQR